MRILSIGNFGQSWDGSICDEEHIAKALEEMGHGVIRMQREQIWEQMPEVDFTLIAQWDGYPEDLTGFPRPLVYLAFDYQADGQEWHDRLVRDCDVYLSKPWSDYKKHPNWRWLPGDFAPDFLDTYEPQDIRYPVLFTGSYLPWATERIETLRAIDKFFSLTIHSFTPNEWKAQGFKDVRGPIMDEGLPVLYSRAAINISIDHTITPGYWSDRNAQIMACEGFVLSRHVPGSELVFRDNIGYFYSIYDCLKKIDYYLKHPNIRDAYAAKGYEFAQTNLMVGNRVHDLLTIVEEFL